MKWSTHTPVKRSKLTWSDYLCIYHGVGIEWHTVVLGYNHCVEQLLGYKWQFVQNRTVHH